MHYQIAAPLTAAADKQADELGRLLKFGKQITVQFVTVAGRYKPARARLTLVTVPDRVADQALRVIQVLAGRDDAVKISAAVRSRPEWTQLALLAPTSPLADPPDGTILEGWDSAYLTVRYQPGRVVAWLACCPEDIERLAQLRLPGWRVTLRPNPLARMFSGSAWRGVPSLALVPGSIVPAAAPARAPQPQPIEDALGWPPADELAGALTSDESGVLLGVAPDGSAVRLARRAMTLALCVPAEAQQGAVLALMRRGMQAGLGMVIAVDRALLPSEALVAWEARVRLLDVQDVASSAAIPWRQIAPELLAQAIAGPDAGEHMGSPPLDRFATVLDALGAEALRVPAVLGLLAAPGDELRGVLAAGGMIVVPQDGDAASTVIARLLLAYLATPPAIGRATLILADPALVTPAALRDQVIQVIIGERADALLRMTATDAGWRLSGPDGTQISELLPDLMTQPSAGTRALVETIVQAIGPAPAALIDEAADWWEGGERSDDLDALDEEPSAAARVESAEEAVATLELPTPAAQQDAALVADDPADSSAPADADIDQPSALDRALGDLLDDEDLDTAQIQQAIIAEECATADALVAEWAAIAVADARPWLWRVVLAEDDADRAAAVYHALRADPHSLHAPQVYAVLAALSRDIGGMPTPEAADPSFDAAGALGDWPVLLEDALVDEHELPAATDDWAVLEQPAEAGFVDVPPDADHAVSEPMRRLAEVAAAPQLMDSAPVADIPPSSMVPAAEATPIMQDAAIRAAWQRGASVLDLIARLVAAGECPAAARVRVRQAINACPAASSAPSLPPPTSALRLTGMSGILAASMPSAAAAPDRDDAAIWQRWQAQEKTEDMIYALCGRRGGPKADAARDRLYAVIVPRIVAELGADELVERLAAGELVANDPRYTLLMQRLARSETPPAGSLEQSLRRRLIAVRQEV
jgi:hypothetical protein